MLEVRDVAGGQRGAVSQRNGGDQSIHFVDWTTHRLSYFQDGSIDFCGRQIEVEDAEDGGGADGRSADCVRRSM